MRRQKQTKTWVTRPLARHRLRLFLFRGQVWQLRAFFVEDAARFWCG